MSPYLIIQGAMEGILWGDSSDTNTGSTFWEKSILPLFLWDGTIYDYRN